jgi:hypothetical protein
MALFDGAIFDSAIFDTGEPTTAVKTNPDDRPLKGRGGKEPRLSQASRR